MCPARQVSNWSVKTFGVHRVKHKSLNEQQREKMFEDKETVTFKSWFYVVRTQPVGGEGYLLQL